MFFRPLQNDLFPKRFVFARPKPTGSDENAVPEAAPAPRKPAEDRMNNIAGEYHDKISDLLDDEDKKKNLLGEKGETLSPKKLLEDMRRLVREDQMKAPEVIKNYRGLYDSLVNQPITPAIRREIARMEYERFEGMLDDTMKERVKEIRSSSLKPTFTEALSNIRSSNSSSARELVDRFNLHATNTVKCHETHRKLKDIEKQIEDKNRELKKIDIEISDHEEKRAKIKEMRDEWDKKKWGQGLGSGKLWGYTKIALGVSLGIGALGALSYGLVGVAGGFGAFSSMFAGLGKGLGFLAESASLGKAAVAGLTGIGIWAYSQVPFSEWAREGHHEIGNKSLEFKKEAEKKRLGIPELEDQKKDALKEVKKYQDENVEGIAALKSEKTKQTTEQGRLNAAIEEAKLAGKDTATISDLQTQLDETTKLILDLDTVLLVLESANKPESIDAGIHLSEDAIVLNIRSMETDSATAEQLMAMAGEKTKEWQDMQNKMMDVKHREGVRKDIGIMDDPEIIKSLKKFFSGNKYDKMLDSDLYKLKIKYPETYTFVRTLQNLPKESVLQKELRDILGPVFEKAEKDLRLKSSREAAAKIFGSLDTSMQDVLSGSPGLIKKVGSTLPAPTGKAISNYEEWLDTFTTDKQFNDLKIALLKIKGGAWVMENEDLVDKVTPIRSKIDQLFSEFTGKDAPLQAYLNRDPENGLQELAKLSGHSKTTFSLATTGGNFLAKIRDTQKIEELLSVRDLLAKLKGNVEINESNKPELVTQLGEEINKLEAELSDPQKGKMQEYNAIMGNPAILRPLSGMVLPVPDSSRGETASYRVYRENLPLGKRKVLRDVLRKIIPDDYILNSAGEFELSTKPMKQGVVDLFETLPGDVKNYLDSKKQGGMRAIASLLSIQGFTLSNVTGSRFADVVKNVKDLPELIRIRDLLEQIILRNIEIDDDKPANGAEMINKINEAFGELQKSSDDKNLKITADAIENDPKLLKTLLPPIEASKLKDPGNDKFSKYITEVPYANKKKILELLKTISRDDYVPNSKNDALIKRPDRIKEDIKLEITKLEDKIENTSKSKKTLKVRHYTTGPAGYQREANFDHPQLPSSIDKDEDFVKILSKIDDKHLNRVRDYLMVLESSNAYYSTKHDQFYSTYKLDEEINDLWKGKEGRPSTINKAFIQKINKDPGLLRILSNNKLPDKGSAASFESYLNDILSDYNLKEILKEVLNDIKSMSEVDFNDKIATSVSGTGTGINTGTGTGAGTGAGTGTGIKSTTSSAKAAPVTEPETSLTGMPKADKSKLIEAINSEKNGLMSNIESIIFANIQDKSMADVLTKRINKLNDEIATLNVGDTKIETNLTEISNIVNENMNVALSEVRKQAYRKALLRFLDLKVRLEKKLNRLK